MNCTMREAETLASRLQEHLADIDDIDVVVCPSFTVLTWVSKLLRDGKIEIGAQDIFWLESGPFTGQVSPIMLKDVGCSFVLIGHSERRGRFGKATEDQNPSSHFSDSDASVNKKLHAALTHCITPIACVGETLAERNEGRTDYVISEQVCAVLNGVAARDVSKIILAYEPVWAIGTGQACNGREANRVISIIRQTVYDIQGTVAADIRIQYGGSVTTNNIGDIISQPEIDGALVGGASLNAKSFSTIVQATSLQGKEN